MKFSPISPTLNASEVMGMSSYHLILANEVAKQPEEWERICYRWRLRGDFIIIDNGTVEEGMMDLRKIIDYAEMTGADEIILPDVLGDSEKTLQLLYDNLSIISLIPIRRRMVVAQGKDRDEWTNCLHKIPVAFSSLGFPKRMMGAKPGERAFMIKELLQRDMTNINFHLLGILGDPLTDLRSFQGIGWRIRGIDSAAPVAWAQHDSWLDQDPGPYSVDLDKPVRQSREMFAKAMVTNLQNVVVKL